MKIKLFLKKNIKIVIAFILGIIISGSSVYAATVASSSVSYNAPTGSVLSDNVQDALDGLYARTKKMTTYENMMCPGCVYRKSTTTKYNVNSSSSNKTDANTKLSSSEYTTDYTTLNENYFLGHVIDGSGYILASYACGINNGTFFCLRGVDTFQSSLAYKPFYQENVNRMNIAYPTCNARTPSSISNCSGDVDPATRIDGEVDVYSGGKPCIVRADSSSYCSG